MPSPPPGQFSSRSKGICSSGLFWSTYIEKIHNKNSSSSAEEVCVRLLEVGLLILVVVGAYGIHQTFSSPTLKRESSPTQIYCHDIVIYVWVLTSGLGLYLLQNTLHRIQRRLLVAMWKQIYPEPNKREKKPTRLHLLLNRTGLGAWCQRALQWAKSRPSKLSVPTPSRVASGIRAEDVVAHFQGLERLAKLRNNAMPGLPIMFLFCWLYAGALDVRSSCLAHYPALGAALYTLSWTGYSTALVCLLITIVRYAYSPMDEGAFFPSAHVSNPSSPPPTLPPLQALVTTKMFCSTRTIIAMILDPLSVLFPTDMVPPFFGYSPFSVGEIGQHEAPTEPVRDVTSTATSTDVSISDVEQGRAVGHIHEGQSFFTNIDSISRGGRGGERSAGNVDSSIPIGDDHDSINFDGSSHYEDFAWPVTTTSLQTSIEFSPIAIRHRNSRSTRSSHLASPNRLNDRASSRDSDTSHSSGIAIAAPSSSAVSSFFLLYFNPRRCDLLVALFLGARRVITLPYSTRRLLCSTCWACLHVLIICLVTSSFYLLGQTSFLSGLEMENCAASRGFVYALAIGFSVYTGLAFWLWKEKENSFREDPEEHALKEVWLLRGLVSLLIISYTWGMMVLKETACYASYPRLRGAVLSYTILGSTLLAVAVILHALATCAWMVLSTVQVIRGMHETMTLFLRFIFRLAPHQAFLERYGQIKRMGRSESNLLSERTIQVAEELSLMPYFHVWVIEGGERREEGGNPERVRPRPVEGSAAIGSGECERWEDERDVYSRPSPRRQHQDEEKQHMDAFEGRGATRSPSPLRALPRTHIPTTPIGRIMGRRTQFSESEGNGDDVHAGRSIFRQVGQYGHVEEEKNGVCEDGSGEAWSPGTDIKDEKTLPAAIRVICETRNQEWQTLPMVCNAIDVPRQSILAATMQSILDVTPLSIDPLRPSPPSTREADALDTVEQNALGWNEDQRGTGQRIQENA